jgi:uncharacterized membrane protein
MGAALSPMSAKPPVPLSRRVASAAESFRNESTATTMKTPLASTAMVASERPRRRVVLRRARSVAVRIAVEKDARMRMRRANRTLTASSAKPRTKKKPGPVSAGKTTA